MTLIRMWENMFSTLEVYGIGRRPCPMTSFGVSSVEPSEQNRAAVLMVSDSGV
jgi:hypothetical protein